jgi:hypothetical protein
MGSCCGEGEEHNVANVNIKDKKKPGEGKVGGDYYSNVNAIESSDIMDYTNEKVREIYS